MARGERRQNLARLREIGEVAARHGFGYLLHRRRGQEDELQDSPLTRGRRLRETFDELGPTFVKFGQLLSTRPDVVPPDVIRELRGLQDAATPFDPAVAKAVIEHELGLTVEQVFEYFEDVPIASASIGQVHRARLPEGREVVVKVQRPDAEEKLRADLQLLYQLARILKERVRRLQFIDTVGLVDEFARTTRRELDYRIEARNIEVARRCFTADETVVVPEVYWRYTTSRVLTLERLEAPTLAHFPLDAYDPDQRRTLASRIAETWMKMIFVHGFFHADPHPANIMVFEPDRIGLIDFGMVGQLTARDRQTLVQLFVDIVEQDTDRVPRRLRELGLRYPKDLEEEFRDQLEVIFQRYYGASLGEIDARELVRDIFQTIYRLRIELPTRWVLLDKALATLGGVGLEISPEFNVFDTARPYARRMLLSRYRPDLVADRMRAEGSRYLETFLQYPYQLAALLEEFRDGEVKITINQEGFIDQAERALGGSNRIVLALLASAFFLGSALLGSFVNAGPELLGVAVIALPGIIGGLIIAAVVVLGIIRSGRL